MWLAQRISLFNFLLLASLVGLAVVDPCWGLPTLSYWYPIPSQSRWEHSKVSIKKKKKSWFRTIFDSVTNGDVAPGPKFLHHTLYWITSADAIQSIFRNQYTDLMGAVPTRRSTENTMNVVYSRLFYFARLRPRLVYAVGALLRALQCCTPLERILDPSIGVGAGINLCAMIATSRWIKPLILGWATTKYVWKWLGAERVQKAYLPITLSIREWDEQKAHKRRSKTEDDES